MQPRTTPMQTPLISRTQRHFRPAGKRPASGILKKRWDWVFVREGRKHLSYWWPSGPRGVWIVFRDPLEGVVTRHRNLLLSDGAAIGRVARSPASAPDWVASLAAGHWRGGVMGGCAKVVGFYEFYLFAPMCGSLQDPRGSCRGLCHRVKDRRDVDSLRGLAWCRANSGSAGRQVATMTRCPPCIPVRRRACGPWGRFDNIVAIFGHCRVCRDLMPRVRLRALFERES